MTVQVTDDVLLKFKPDFGLISLSASESVWHARNKDKTDLALEWADQNHDGLPDVTVFCSEGRQVLYQLSP